MEKNLIINFGSGTITLLCGRKKYDGSLKILNYCQHSYTGIYECDFIDIESLKDDIISVINDSGYAGNYKEVSVGVPNCFLSVVTNSQTINLDSSKLISLNTINELKHKCLNFNINSQYKGIKHSIVSYVVDDNEVTFLPIGYKATTLKINMAFVLCQKKFVDIISNILQEIGFLNINYIDSMSSCVQSFVEEDVQLKGIIVCNIGYLQTQLSYIQLKTLLDAKYIENGVAYIADNLSQAFNLPYNDCYTFLSQIDLCKQWQNGENYSIAVNGEAVIIDANTLNNIVFTTLQELAMEIARIIALINYPIEKSTKILICGQEILDIKGAIAYLQNQVERKFSLFYTDVKDYNSPRNTICMGLMDNICKTNNKNKKWF